MEGNMIQRALRQFMMARVGFTALLTIMLVITMLTQLKANTTQASASETGFARVYQYRVTDSRGYPAPLTEVSIENPTQHSFTDIMGVFQIRLSPVYTPSLSFGHLGYNSFSPVRIIGVGEPRRGVYLPSVDDVIKGGDFENSFTAWSTSTSSPGVSLVPTLTIAESRSGWKSVAFGQDNSDGIPLTVEPTPAIALTFPSITFDSSKTLHMVWNNYSAGQVNYASRSFSGSWTSAIQLGPSHDGVESYLTRPRIGVDSADNLYVAWNYADGLHYRQQISGVWSTDTIIAPSSVMGGLAVDPMGGVHITACCINGQIYYKERLPSGEWQAPISIFQADPAFVSQRAPIAVGSDGTLYALYTDGEQGGIGYRARKADRTWTGYYKLANGYAGNTWPDAITIDRDGLAYAVWTDWWNGLLFFAYGSLDTGWSNPEVAAKVSKGEYWLENTDVFADWRGNIHLVNMTMPYLNWNEGGIFYRQRSRLGWSNPVNLPYDYDNPRIAGSKDGEIYIISKGNGYSWPSVALSEARYSLSQTVFISPTVHMPTLAFSHKLRTSGRAVFEVLVQNAVTPTVVYSSSATSDWTNSWINMSQWLGQSITLTFTLKQAPSELSAQMFLDDVSLGSWNTPVISATSIPPHMDPYQSGISVSITGTNFIPTPIVKLNEQELQNVNWLSDEKLQATLPSYLGPGIYDLWVTNPRGQDAVLAGILKVGKQVYLPILSKN
jgi:hypothetical protein